MTLSRKQKKFIKKHRKKASVEEMAVSLGALPKEIEEYLKKRWGKDKYQKFLRKEKRPQIAVDKTPEKKNWLILIFLTLLGLVIYINTLNHEFVADDVYSFVKNEDFGDARQIFSSFPVFLRLLIFYILNKIFGVSPAAFRLVNIFFHLGTLWVSFLLVSLVLNRTVAFFAATLMAVHPVLTEAVTWISGGPYSQSAFFVLLSFLFFLFSEKKRKFYFFSLTCFLLALFTSEKVMSFPFILLVFVLSFKRWRFYIKKLTAPFIITGIWMLIYILRIPRRVMDLEAITHQEPFTFERFLEVPIAISSYLELIFWPKNLSIYHSEMRFSILAVFIRLIVLLIFLGVIALSFKKNRQIFFWLSFFIISLLPTLVPGVSWIVAERYVYLGSLGIFVVVGIGLKKLTEFKNWKPGVYILFALLIMVLAWRSIRRNLDWKNQDTLWIAAARTSPSSPQNHNNLGDLYGRRGEYEKAAEEFKIAIALRPSYADAYHNLANTYQQMGKLDLAIENYQKALEYKPVLWQSHQNLAAIFFGQEDYEQAEAHLQKAVQLNPESSELYTNLAIVYIKREKLQTAKKALEEALKLDPENSKANSLLLQLFGQ